MEQHEVEEVSFLPGEAILNKKAVYEPSRGQRFRQIVCSRGIAICILLGMGATMVTIALIAAFARPMSLSGQNNCPANTTSASPELSASVQGHNSESTPNYIATNGQDFPWKNLRLPSSVIPVNYNIFLHPNISSSYFKGKVKMTLKIAEPTDFVVFHTHELNLSDVSVAYVENPASRKSCILVKYADERSVNLAQQTGKIGIKKQLEYLAHQQYYIQVEKLLMPGTMITVSVAFRGSMADLAKMSGFYKSVYTVNGEKRYMASTHFESTHARSAFPCMDEPALKATFTMSIVRNTNLITLFNTKRQKTQPYQNGLILDVYEPTVCMSSYLVAYVVTDFKSTMNYTKDGVMVRVWAPADKIYMGKFALEAAVRIIEKYNEFFGISYPLSKQDLIAIPNFAAGAMENWGLITYRDTAVLYDPEKSTIYSKKRVAEVVAHELAHQWFGNLVTMKWWNDLWLNEGFASYVENIGADYVDPNLHMFESLALNALGALKLDSYSSSHPIQVEVEDPIDAESAFNTITYQKGASLILMLKGAIGQEDFHNGLNDYLKTYAYSNAQTSELWDSFEKKSHLVKGLTVSKIMDTWTKQMGYPVITVTRHNNQITLTQERFLLNNDSDSDTKGSPYNYKWYVPFKYKLSDDVEKTQMIWMKQGSASILLPSSTTKWIKGNADKEGFYRVNYDGQGWKEITLQLMTNHTVFSVLDRVGLIDDAFHLAQSGRLSYSVPLELCQYLVKETDYFVWSTVNKNLNELEGHLFLHESYDDLKKYMLHLAKPLIDSVGWNDDGSYSLRLLRVVILSLAIRHDYEPAVTQAKGWFTKWKADDSVKLNNDLRGIIFYTGVKHGTKKDWDLVYERFQSSIVPANKETLLVSLAASRDARVLQIFLERSLDSNKIKSQSTATVLSAVSSNPTGMLYAYRFLQQNWAVFEERYGSGAFTLGSIFKHVLRHFDTQFDLDEVTSFFKDKEVGSAAQALQQAKDVIKSNMAWQKHNLASVSSWLGNFAKSSGGPR